MIDHYSVRVPTSVLLRVPSLTARLQLSRQHRGIVVGIIIGVHDCDNPRDLGKGSHDLVREQGLFDTLKAGNIAQYTTDRIAAKRLAHRAVRCRPLDRQLGQVKYGQGKTAATAESFGEIIRCGR